MAPARLDRRRLEIALTRIPDHPAPRPELEQVRTPGPIAARFLLAAAEEGHIVGKRVADLGCGTGVLAVGAALLGAERVVGIDIDVAALDLARAAAAREEVSDTVVWHSADLLAMRPAEVTELAGGPLDAVVMNPPFGADLKSRARGGDRVFLSLALRSAPIVYSLHPAHTEGFLVAFARDAGFRPERLEVLDFPLVARFAHHAQATRTLPVGLYRFERT